MTTNASGRVLTELEERLLQRIREMEAEVALLGGDVKAVAAGVEGPSPHRHLNMARDHLEIGFMLLVKALTRPSGGIGNPVF